MAITVSSKDILFGPPSSITFSIGSTPTDLGASEDPAKLTITTTRYEPDFINATGPLSGLTRITKIKAELTTRLNELSLTKLQAMLQNASIATVAGTPVTYLLTESIGAIPAAQHGNLVVTAVGPDGNNCVITLQNALQVGNLDIIFGITGPTGTPVTFRGYSDPTTPTLAPFSIQRVTQ